MDFFLSIFFFHSADATSLAIPRDSTNEYKLAS